MQSKKHIIIFSHGFGVRKDDVGLFTDIVKAVPEVESILFDYFDVDEKNKILTIRPFSTQVKMLNDVVKKARESDPEATIDLICHSQGTMTAALAKPDGIRKTIFLAPVLDMSIERTLKRYGSDPDSDINLDGISKLRVFDGFLRIVPREYWAERKKIKPFKEYNEFAQKTELIVIEANQDEILSKVDLKDLNSKIKLMSLDGNHGFSGKARKNLIKTVREIIL